MSKKLINSIENMESTKQEKQVVSRRKVSDHGEVYTAKREVNAMLDLVKQEHGLIWISINFGTRRGG